MPGTSAGASSRNGSGVAGRTAMRTGGGSGRGGDSIRRGEKSPQAFRTISEVAQDLDVPPHVLRFWETKFSQVRPLKRGGGRRYYRPEDVDLLRRIRVLLYREGYTIKGVQRVLREGGPAGDAAGMREAAAKRAQRIDKREVYRRPKIDRVRRESAEEDAPASDPPSKPAPSDPSASQTASTESTPPEESVESRPATEPPAAPENTAPSVPEVEPDAAMPTYYEALFEETYPVEGDTDAPSVKATVHPSVPVYEPSAEELANAEKLAEQRVRQLLTHALPPLAAARVRARRIVEELVRRRAPVGHQLLALGPLARCAG